MLDISFILDTLLKKDIREVTAVSIKTVGENFLRPKKLLHKLH